jgi:hypothetical protein
MKVEVLVNFRHMCKEEGVKDSLQLFACPMDVMFKSGRAGGDFWDGARRIQSEVRHYLPMT